MLTARRSPLSLTQEAIDDPEYREKEVQSIPWKRALGPWEIARLAMYLVSEEADYVTGQPFFIDGGLMMNQGRVRRSLVFLPRDAGCMERRGHMSRMSVGP